MNGTPKEIEQDELLYRSLDIRHTDHAVERIKERFGLPRASVLKLANEAKNNGEFFIRDSISDRCSISFNHKDKTFIFTKNNFYGDPILLLVTAHYLKPELLAEKTHLHVKGTPITLYRKNSTKSKAMTRIQQRKADKYKHLLDDE